LNFQDFQNKGAYIMLKDEDKQNNICFILTGNGYEQITYAEFCRREETDTTYKDKLFIVLRGMLMEVTAKDYLDFYKVQRRQKYIDERSAKNGDFSYDMLTTDDFNGEEILIDDSEDIATQVVHKIMLDKLSDSILLLSDDEQKLISEIFFEELSERTLAKKYGVSQVTIHKRKVKILDKLKKIIEK